MAGHGGRWENARAGPCQKWHDTGSPNKQAQDPKVTLAGGRRWAMNQLRADFRHWWSATKHSGTIPLSPPTPSPPPDIPRSTLARVLAARSGHGDFAQYHDRFNPDNAKRPHQCRA